MITIPTINPTGSGATAAVDELTVSFDRRVALDRVSFEVPAGRCTALMGPNGSGKTTLLRCLADLQVPDAGRVDVPPSLRPVAYLQQRHDGHPWMPLTVEEVIRMGCFGAKGLTRRLGASDRRRVRDDAARLEVEHLLGRQFGELSGGQQQRVLLAQALVQQPRLLLLDEPVTGLDLASQGRILDLVDDLTQAGVAVVLSTHHLDEARRCDQVVLLDGAALAVGPPDAVLTSANLEQAFTGRTLHAAEGGAVELIDEHGHGTFDGASGTS